MNTKDSSFAPKGAESQDIDAMELIAKLWKSKKYILRWCLIGAVIGLVAAFSIPKTYRVKAVIAPETQARIGSGVSSIASMMGVSIDNSMDAIDVEMYPDVVASTPFLFELLALEVETKDGELKTTLSDYIRNHQKQPWWSHVLRAPFKAVGWVKDLVSPSEDDDTEGDMELDIRNLPKSERGVIRYLAKEIHVNVDKKTAKTEFSLEMQDPYVAAEVLEVVISHLKSYMTDYRTTKSRQDVENLSVICEERKQSYYDAQNAYTKYLDANSNVSTSSKKAELQRLQQEMTLAYQVYSQIATQLEGARIKVQQEKPVFVVLEPVTVPYRKSAPSKAKMLVLFTFLFGCGAAAWVLFGKELWMEFKDISGK